MTRYLLDTNIASHIIKNDIAAVLQRLLQVPMHNVAISAVTEAELLYGVAKRGNPAGLTARVKEFLARVEVMPWTSDTAKVYGTLRATCEAKGVTLASMDMMIAAHAKALGTVLVTRDKAFSRVPQGLVLEDWTQALH
jgi:tRNA(fMet)-specific endonuclease VapC